MTKNTPSSIGLKGFGLIWIVLIGVFVLIFGAMVIERIVFNDIHLNPPKMGKTATGEDCLPDPNPQLKQAFIDHSKILFIHPLGNTQFASPNSSHIVLKEGVDAPIYNPHDAKIEEISEKDGKYTVSLRISCEISYTFSNLDKLAQKDIKPKSVIKKGELLGYVSGTAQGEPFTFSLLNTTKPIAHINSNRWQDSKSLYAQCPYEYFDSRFENNLKNIYIGYTLVHNENIIPKVWDKNKGYNNIPCGQLSHDSQGTISGGWFKGGSTDTKGDYLSINKYLSTVQVSLKKDGQMIESLTDYSPDILLADTKIGEAVCYHDQNQNKWAYIKLVTNASLALAKGTGNCPQSSPQSFDIWER